MDALLIWLTLYKSQGILKYDCISKYLTEADSTAEVQNNVYLKINHK